MRKLPVHLLLMLLATSLSIGVQPESSGAQEAVPGFEFVATHGESAYYVSTGTALWQDAEAACSAAGGHLATITSAGENEAVARAADDSGAEAVWIGLADLDDDRVFTWVTGEPLDYTNWHANNPSDSFGDEQYVFLYADTEWNRSQGAAGMWNDVAQPRDGQYPYVLERPISVDDTYQGTLYVKVRGIASDDVVVDHEVHLARYQLEFGLDPSLDLNVLASARTNSAGVALFEGLNPGYYGVRSASDPNGTWEIARVEAGRTTSLELRVATAIALRGRVVDGLNGRAIPGATVELHAGTTVGATADLELQTDSRGRFVLEAPQAGEYTIQVHLRRAVGTSLDVADLYVPLTTGLSVGVDEAEIDLGNLSLESNTLVLVHGINARPEGSWQESGFADAMRAGGWAVIDDITLPHCLQLPQGLVCGFASVPEQARFLRRELDGIHGVRSFSLVAHSQGGLVSRWLIEQLGEGDRVHQLVTLATPHHGSQWATEISAILAISGTLAEPGELSPVGLGSDAWWALLAEFVPGLVDLRPNSDMLNTLNGHDREHWPTASCLSLPLPESHIDDRIPYTTYAGTHGWASTNPLYQLGYLLLWMPPHFCAWNDGVVPMLSARLASTAPNVRNYLDTDPSIATRNFHRRTTTLSVTRDPAVHGWVLDVLAGTAAPPAAQAATTLVPETMASPASAPSWATMTTLTDRVPAASTVDSTVAIDAGDSLRVTWTWSGGDVDLALVSPSGARVDSLAAVGDGSLRYLRDTTFGIGALVVAAPETGQWTIETTNGAVQDSGQVFVEIAGFDVAVAGLTITPLGSDMFAERRIALELLAQGVGVTGATTSAWIDAPDAARRELALNDDGTSGDLVAGDGIYSTTILPLSVHGPRVVGFEAESATSPSFVRSGSETFWIGRTTDVRVDSLSVEVVDGTLSALVDVTNVGPEDGDVVVRVWEEISGEVLLEEVRSLGAGDTERVPAPYVPSSLDDLKIVAEVAPVGDLGEADASDNRATLQIAEGLVVTSVSPGQGDVPPEGALVRGPVSVASVSPNPFNPRTSIEIRTSRPGPLRVEVFDLRGRSVTTLSEGWFGGGLLRLEWDGTDRGGRGVGSGVYLVRAAVPDHTASRRIVLLK